MQRSREEIANMTEEEWAAHTEEFKREMIEKEPNRYFILGPDGRTPVESNMFDAFDWQREDPERVRVGLTEVGPFSISTVFLIMNHRFFGNAPPLHFESMIFDHNGRHTGDLKRYTTFAQAEAGHVEMVALVQAEVDAKARGDSDFEYGLNWGSE